MSEREKRNKTNTMLIIEMNKITLGRNLLICYLSFCSVCVKKSDVRFALFPPLFVGVLVVFKAFINQLGSLNIPIDVDFKDSHNGMIEINDEEKMKPEIANKKS